MSVSGTVSFARQLDGRLKRLGVSDHTNTSQKRMSGISKAESGSFTKFSGKPIFPFFLGFKKLMKSRLKKSPKHNQ